MNRFCSSLIRLSLICFSLVSLIVWGQASSGMAGERVTFSAGAPLEDYQALMIVPLLREAFRRQGIEFQAVHAPSERSLVMSNSGEVDGELHRVYDFHRLTEGKYSNLIRIESALLSVYLAAFARRDDINIDSWQGLSGYSVAYQRGRKNLERKLAQVMPEGDVLSLNSDDQAFSLVAKGRVDVVLSESREGQKRLKRSPELKRLREVKRLQETRIYAYMHHKHRPIVPIIAQTLDAMKQDGSFDAIVNRVNQEYDAAP